MNLTIGPALAELKQRERSLANQQGEEYSSPGGEPMRRKARWEEEEIPKWLHFKLNRVKLKRNSAEGWLTGLAAWFLPWRKPIETSRNESLFRLREISHSGGMGMVPELLEIALSDDYPARIRSVASEAVQRIASRAGAEIREEAERVASREVAKQLAKLLRGPTLKNYRGLLCAQLLVGDEAQPAMPRTVFTGTRLRVQVWLQSGNEGPKEAIRELIDIRDGDEAGDEAIEFEIGVDGDGMEFRPRNMTRSVLRHENSVAAVFPTKAPDKPGKYSIWVQVFQGARLLQAIKIPVEVAEYKPQGR